MKKIFSFVVVMAAVAMVSCCGNSNKKAAEGEAAAAAAITGEHPVLLLDDVLSELDDGRKQYLLTRMREKQTFVTSCDDTAFLKTDGEVYRMNGGVLSRI